MDRMQKFFSRSSDRFAKIIFILPALIAICALMIFPIAFNIYISLHRWFLGGRRYFIGFKNYQKLFRDPRFLNSIVVTFKFVIPSVILCVGLGLLVALLLNRDFKGKGFIRTITLLPMLATPAAMAVIWMIIFNPSLGVLNYFLSLVGIGPQLWVNSSSGAIPSLILVDVLKWIPLPMIIILAALQSTPTSPFEAANIDGANKWQIFRYITFPFIKPAIMTAVILRTIDCLKTFDTIFVMTQGGPDIASETLELYTFKTGFVYFELGYSSAAAIILTTLILLISGVMVKVRGKNWHN